MSDHKHKDKKDKDKKDKDKKDKDKDKKDKHGDKHEKRHQLKAERDQKRAAKKAEKHALREKERNNRHRRRNRPKFGLDHPLHNRPIQANDHLHGCVAGIADHNHGGGDAHGHAPHWTYEGKTGAEHWAELGFKDANGKEQSPIDINTKAVQDIALPKLDIDYEDEDATIINNGHTIQVNWPAGSMKIGEKVYQLLQFHFHAPSEHTIDGKSFPLEMHLVHKADDGQLAVLGVLFKEKSGAKPNEFLAQFWDHLPTQPMEEGEQPIPLGELDADDLELSIKKHYRYNGSLTTPPCTEGVVWTVLAKAESCSQEQVQHFMNILKTKTNRPVQPLCSRKVLI